MMIAELISKLTRRKAEATQAAANGWQKLVAEFVDQGDKADVDGILSELDQLGRTLEDLEAAAELLTQRRAWASTVTEGDKAEVAYPALVKEDENSV